MNKDDILKNLSITTREDKESYVFVSYKSDDWKEVFADYVMPLVDKYGLKIYVDKSFDDYNDYWLQQMERHITDSRCKAVLIFVSDKYLGSYATLLEVIYAINNDKQIVPICLCDDIESLKDDICDEWFGVMMKPAERKQLSNQFMRMKCYFEGRLTEKPIVALALSEYYNMELDIKNEKLEKGKMALAFLKILLNGELQYNKKSASIEQIANTIRSIDKSVFREKHCISEEGRVVKNRTSILKNTNSNIVAGGLCQLDWLNWKGKLPEVKGYSFVIEYKNMRYHNCKNWASVWRELLEILGQDENVRKRILQLRDDEIKGNKHSLKTFFNGQANLKKHKAYTRSYHVKSLEIDIENYWNKENMCKEIKKLCKALELNEKEIVIKGILLEK